MEPSATATGQLLLQCLCHTAVGLIGVVVMQRRQTLIILRDIPQLSLPTVSSAFDLTMVNG
jgi:hypothetical protein